MMLKPKLQKQTQTLTPNQAAAKKWSSNPIPRIEHPRETMVDLGEWKTSWDHMGVLNIRGMARAGLEWIQLIRCSYNLQIRLSKYITRPNRGPFNWALMINRARHHELWQSPAKPYFYWRNS